MGKRNFKRIEIPESIDVASLSPIEISCGSTKCSEDLHCFSLKASSIKRHGKDGVCKECGVELIDWERVNLNKLNDSEYLFQSLKKELFRHVIWHYNIDDAINKARTKTIDELKQQAKRILNKNIKNKPFRDGMQTPVTGSEITYYAQHATATCCRKCIEVWHGIPVDQELSDQQITYFTELVMLFIREKLRS